MTLFSKNIKKLSDTHLVLHYRNTGKNSYFNELFERYYHLVYGVCLKYLKNESESADAVLMIFEKMSDDIKNTEITHFKSWLYTVSKNHCLMKIRSDNRKQKHVNQFEQEYSAELTLPEINEYELTESKIQKLEKAINQLKTGQKECIVLFYLEQNCYDEIAKITGFTNNEVRSHIQNGKRNLRILMTEE
ncbi:MAG: hypothetical protein A2W91_04115 [Bacteroidetes bacterium GWF2_38_335]|nr:MAG: hypothetical protein A2W91_04115 [Bacteroidetes bacterium GWF2_38_335]OFY79136.1 MAG: hypothetical protein A2281_03450 [Bacteroidetes bacterium RIFOXYA12_FULL_38_20]HBS88777.1 RNA polymerase subunit sigma-24 [Bacteroidales bacterium]